MVNTYEEYLQMEKALPVEQMEVLHREMLKEIGTDADALEIYGDLIGKATSYAEMRAKWQGMSMEEKRDSDPLRTSYHNAVILHLNMLARYLKMQGMDAKWRDMLGYEEDSRYNRKTIGDFACYLVFLNSICSR